MLDANIVIGFLLSDDALHAAARAALAAVRAREDDFVLPASVLSESMVGGYRHGTYEELHRRIAGLFGPARPLDEDVALRAAELRAAHRSLRLPDALVVATGIVDDAAVLTGDRRLGEVDPRVQVLAP